MFYSNLFTVIFISVIIFHLLNKVQNTIFKRRIFIKYSPIMKPSVWGINWKNTGKTPRKKVKNLPSLNVWLDVLDGLICFTL